MSFARGYTIRIVFVLIVVILSGLAFYHFALRRNPVSVIVRPVERGRVDRVVANTRAGTVKACRRARLAPAVGGQIETLLVKEGDSVKKGQVLLRLWNKDLAAELELAQKDAAASLANNQDICIQAKEARREAGRLRRLHGKSLVAAQESEKAVSIADAMDARCRAALAGYKSAVARIAQIRANLERTILKAPFDGTIAEVNGEIGEFITPSPTGVATLPAVDLFDPSRLYVSAPLDEVDAPAVRPGMDAQITLDAFPGRVFPGKVRRVAPYVLELEKQARTVQVDVDFTEPLQSLHLLPGYSADVEIILAVHKDVLRVPAEAVLENNRVFVYRKDTGRLEERTVRTGLANWQFVEVLSGLKAGELVVVSPERKGVGPGVYARPEKSSGAGG